MCASLSCLFFYSINGTCFSLGPTDYYLRALEEEKKTAPQNEAWTLRSHASLCAEQREELYCTWIRTGPPTSLDRGVRWVTACTPWARSPDPRRIVALARTCRVQARGPRRAYHVGSGMSVECTQTGDLARGPTDVVAPSAAKAAYTPYMR